MVCGVRLTEKIDVDNLEDSLFASSFSKKQEKSSSAKTAVKSALKSPSYDGSTERLQKSHVTFDSPDKSFGKSVSKKPIKKNIDFGDFNADDPLDGLLSDEDDFYDKKKNTGVFKSNTAESTGKQESGYDPSEPKKKQNRSKVVAELFGLEEEKKQPQQSQNDGDSSASWLGLKDSLPAENKTPEVAKSSSKTPEHVLGRSATKQAPASRKAGSRSGGDDDGDLLAGMGFGSEVHGAAGRQPKSKLDEVLGKNAPGNEVAAPPLTILDDLLGKKKSSGDRMSAGGNALHPTQIHEPASGVSFGNYSPSVSASGRRPTSRRNSGTAIVPDPLGILSTVPSPNKENRHLSSSNLGHKTVDWLGVSVRGAPPVTATNSDSPERRQRISGGNQPLPVWLRGGGTVMAEPPHTQPEPAMSVSGKAFVVPATASVSLSQPMATGMEVLTTGSQMDQQVVAALQHQEMQLLTALHMKQHEERLSALQVRQQEILQRQEQQLEELIRRQIERQEQLDVHMRSQQERIGAHIQLLLAQPVTDPAIAPTVVTPSSAVNNESQAAVEQVRTESRHLESVLESLKAKHLEEVQLLEESYSRQIAMLESTSKRQEQRLRAENECLEKEYQAKIIRIQEEQASLIEQHHLRLRAQQKEHAEELQQLRELHHQDLEEARKQHSDMLEHLNRARTMENDALKEASSYSRSLHAAVEQLGQNSQQLSGLQTELSSQHHSHLDIREVTLQAREVELRVARENLGKQRTASEEERKRLIGLVSQLEQKLAEQKQNAEEERWNLRQEAARLDATAKALEKERERAMQQIDRERQELQSLKESMLSEQQTLSQQLQQEKLSLASEKSRLETLARLHGTPSPDILKLRAELEAGLEVVQEASQQAQSECEKIRNQHRRLEEEKRRLEDLEHDLTSRARELETLSQMAVATKAEGKWALEEARRIEKQRSEQTADIQKQLVELRDREKRLAQEKVLLSQERLALQNLRGQDLCSYCRRSKTVMLSPPPTPPDLDKRFVDPKLIIMKLAAEDEASRLEQDSRFFSAQFSASK
ncbi:fas-binding factor 1 isoform X2 [Zootermopsis nevadensis]|uniref:fas-binding factor 1 isoform X2 n=1 Tax=Zootermopsis nevadensis TaxID=136037 RepID=UPI000B8EC257|nr:fas-binding factor 1 isoform X2 [Zootermopsis nevadensis]